MEEKKSASVFICLENEVIQLMCTLGHEEKTESLHVRETSILCEYMGCCFSDTQNGQSPTGKFTQCLIIMSLTT